MFVGRSRELNKLNALYNSNRFEFVVFYGRRRVGKTTLINEFTEQKKSIYYMAVEGTKKENLSGLSKAFPRSHWHHYLNLTITKICCLTLTNWHYLENAISLLLTNFLILLPRTQQSHPCFKSILTIVGKTAICF